MELTIGAVCLIALLPLELSLYLVYEPDPGERKRTMILQVTDSGELILPAELVHAPPHTSLGSRAPRRNCDRKTDVPHGRA
jgi:hypothetical protein